MFCENCGNQIQDGASVCTQCGFAVKQKKSKVLIIALIVSLMVIIVVLGSIIIKNHYFNAQKTNGVGITESDTENLLEEKVTKASSVVETTLPSTTQQNAEAAEKLNSEVVVGCTQNCEIRSVADENDTYVNLRTGPSTDYEIVAQIPNYTAITACGVSQDYKWRYVKYNSVYGWVYNDFIGNGIAKTLVDYDDTYVNLRRGPSTDYDVICRLSNNVTVYAFEYSDDGTWRYIRHGNTYGWVYAEFLYN